MLGSDITVAMVNGALPGSWRCRAITHGGQAQLEAQRTDRTLTVLMGGTREGVLAAIPVLLPALDALADAVAAAVTVELALGPHRAGR